MVKPCRCTVYVQKWLLRKFEVAKALTDPPAGHVEFRVRGVRVCHSEDADRRRHFSESSGRE